LRFRCGLKRSDIARSARARIANCRFGGKRSNSPVSAGEDDAVTMLESGAIGFPAENGCGVKGNGQDGDGE